jgi:sugar O-acyltransferase (sialic acid O-acetyltransferase NeuD family)
VTTGLVIVGCGGFGREVLSLVAAINSVQGPVWTIEGFLDDSPSGDDRARIHALGSCILGTVASLSQRRDVVSVIIAIGSPSARRTVASRLDGANLRFPPLVHPAATIGRAVTLSPGVVVAAGARLTTNIELGAHVQVDQNATIGHDTQVGAYSRLNPQACVSGCVRIGTGVLIGANCTILASLSVGSGATVGAHACVVHDVPDFATVKGVPAR